MTQRSGVRNLADMSDPELFEPVPDPIDHEALLRANTVDHVAKAIQGLLNAMAKDGMNPVRALRLIETLAVTTRDQLAELGTAEESGRRRLGGGNVAMGANFGVGGGHAQDAVMLDQVMGFLGDMTEQTRGEFRTRQIRNLTGAIKTAKDMEDDDLRVRLKGQLDDLMSDGFEGTEPKTTLLDALADDEGDDEPVLVPRVKGVEPVDAARVPPVLVPAAQGALPLAGASA